MGRLEAFSGVMVPHPGPLSRGERVALAGAVGDLVEGGGGREAAPPSSPSLLPPGGKGAPLVGPEGSHSLSFPSPLVGEGAPKGRMRGALSRPETRYKEIIHGLG
jgi:hypothetical protein